jgi:hypothetical protein
MLGFFHTAHFVSFSQIYAMSCLFMAVAIGIQGSPILICLWLGSPHFRMAFVLLSTAFVAVVLLVLYRAYKPSKTYGIFLSHHKLGAAVQLDKIDGKIAQTYGTCEMDKLQDKVSVC